MRDNPFSGVAEDDPEKFFRRSPWDVGSGDMWRWHACCLALRKIEQEELANGPR